MAIDKATRTRYEKAISDARSLLEVLNSGIPELDKAMRAGDHKAGVQINSIKSDITNVQRVISRFERWLQA